MRTHSPRTLAATVFGLVAGLAISVTIAAQADGGEPRRTIPYSGYVDFDGQPVNAGAVKFNFALFPCATPGAGVGQCAPLWLAKGAWANGFPANQSVSLPIFAGRFSVELGADGQAELPDEVFMSDYATLYLSIQIEGKTLGTLQKVTATPRAIASSEADRFRVRSEVTFDDPLGGAARVMADDGLVIDHDNPAQDKLLRVGAGENPPLVVSADGAVVNGELVATAVGTSTLTAATATIGGLALEGALTAPNGRVRVDGYTNAYDTNPSRRAGLVYDSNDRLDARLEGSAKYATVDGLPVIALTGGYVEVLASLRPAARIRAGQGYTVMMWIKPTTVTGLEELASSYDCSIEDMTMEIQDTNRTIVFYVRDSSNTRQVVYSTSEVRDTNWHHVVGVRDAPGNSLRIYFDGALEASAALAGEGAGGHLLDNRLMFGSLAGCSGSVTRPFHGHLDAIRIYQRALSDTEVADFYKATKGMHP